MKALLSAIVFIALCSTAWTQPYGNEWIDYNPDRIYFKFKAGKARVYRIDYATLSNALQYLSAPPDISTIDPRSFQVFARGEEQYVHVQGQSDGSFDPGDYVEFFADTNSGWLDERMYPSADQHTNPYYSHYSDSLTYFLTWDPEGATSAFRLTTVPFTSAAATPMPYFLSERVKPWVQMYHKGRDLGSDVSIVQYSGGKGWTSRQFGYNIGGGEGLITWTAKTPNAYTSGGAIAEFEIGAMGFNQGAGGSNAHHLRLRNSTSNNYSVFDDIILGTQEYRQHSTTLPAATFSTASHNFQAYISSVGSQVNANADYCVVAYMRLLYPHLPNFLASEVKPQRFIAEASATDVFFNATGWNTTTTSYLYDLGLHQRYEVLHNTSAGTLKTNIAAGDRRYLFLAADASTVTLTAADLKPAGTEGRFTDPMTLEKDSAFLIISHDKLWSKAQEYATYRNGTHQNRVVMLNIDDLYDQFSYGVRYHPLAIRGFADLCIDQWNSKPQYLLLLGKSTEEASIRFKNVLGDYYRSQNMVPSMGYPASDAYLTANLNENNYAPEIATGRVAAVTPSQLDAYLDKVMALEATQLALTNTYTIDQRAWQKRILLFAGGNSGLENNTFRNNLNTYANQLEGASFAGTAHLYSKTTSTVIEQVDIDSLRQLLQDGVALMTFFGHGTTTGFDINVDDPTEWQNEGLGRYPFVFANSCYSGNIHKPEGSEPGISSLYVFAPNEGAIAFVATTDLSRPDYLHSYSTQLYHQIATAAYGKSIGEQMRLASRTLTNGATGSDDYALNITAVCLDMSLHGDPALKIFPHSKSELTINDPTHGGSYSISPQVITTDLDSFDVQVRITNLGQYATKDVVVQLTRLLPGSAQPTEYLRVLNGMGYEGSVVFRLPVDPVLGVGENSLRITVDLPQDSIAEFDNVVNNTIAQVKIQIVDANITPVVPYNFAVVPDFNVTLKANTGDPFAPSATYLLQLDTTDTYDSPFMKNTSVTQVGAVVTWDIGDQLATQNFPDSTVFFWRVTPSTDLSKWKEYSFQVIQDQHGWGQDHFFQFKDNAFEFIRYDREQRRIAFEPASRELTVRNIGLASTANEVQNVEYRLDGQLGELGESNVEPGGQAAMAIVVIDTFNLTPWGCYGLENGVLVNADRQFGNSNNYLDDPADRRARPEYFFTFEVEDPVQMDSMISMVSHKIPQGYYLLAYSLKTALFETPGIWEEAHFAAFEALGADSIRYIGNNRPYIFLTRIGEPDSSIEVIGADDHAHIQLRKRLYSNFKQGWISGPEAGPAMAWNTLTFQGRRAESAPGDLVEVTPYAIKPNDDENALTKLSGSGSLDLSTLSADTVEQLRLELYTADNAFGTPVQLKSWHLFYEPAPDAAINPVRGTVWPGEKLVSGIPFQAGFTLENISEYDFDSLRVHYRIDDARGATVSETTLVYASLTAGQQLLDTVTFSTAGLSGRYTFWMEANPQDEHWHREENHFNNRAFRSFEIIGDDQNPLLDVTFDGIHILNGDIVSPTPEIVLELQDENTYLLLDDTNAIDVFLTTPEGVQYRIPYVRQGTEIMQFEAATGKKNKARITYKPEALSDGVYTLQAMGRDKSGNASGDKAYDIEFEVINKSMVTHAMNYPNPFTTSTQFVFTLTGSKLPDVFTIQILSVTGKVVREITIDELGPLHIGRNITTYAWDGTDEYGDRLANGLYVYRVIMKINGQSIERMESGADNYFTKEFGKMYLFR